MSLLLDALQRASKDKERAALAAAGAALVGPQATLQVSPAPAIAPKNTDAEVGDSENAESGLISYDGQHTLSAPTSLLADSTPDKVPQSPNYADTMALEPATPRSRHPTALATTQQTSFETPVGAPSLGDTAQDQPLSLEQYAAPKAPSAEQTPDTPPVRPVADMPPFTPTPAPTFLPSPGPATQPQTPVVESAFAGAPPLGMAAASAAAAIQNGYSRPQNIEGGSLYRYRRVLSMAVFAVVVALGLGSWMAGWWGDPLQMLGLSSSSSLAGTAQAPLATEPASAAVIAPLTAAEPPIAAVSAAVEAGSPTPAMPGITSAADSGPASSAPMGPTKVLPARIAPGARANTSPVPNGLPQHVTSTELAVQGRIGTQGNATTAPTSALSLSVRTPGQTLLEQGYAALTNARFDDATRAYRGALEANPTERDALLGLAYINHSTGQRDTARAYYQQVLRQEPNNPVARAGLIALDTSTQTTTADQAKALAANQGDSAAAQALLGNALVRENQLANAAQAFARAQSLEPGNALHAYNLAVALDKQNNYRQALQNYDRALAVPQGTATGLSAQQASAVRTRIDQLREALAAEATRVPTSEHAP